jgi:protein transport protein SEC31
MTILKRVDRNATVGFAPHSGLMAAGTVAGAIDMSFSTSSVLEVRGMVACGACGGNGDGGGVRGRGASTDLYTLHASIAQLYSLDFASPGEALPMVGSAQAPERFNRLAWGPRMPDSAYQVGQRTTSDERPAVGVTRHPRHAH